jgi:hypothetical protein
MRSNLICRLVLALCLGATVTLADSLELKNGSLIKGKYLGDTATEIRFQVGSSVQRYEVADLVSLKFESETRVSEAPPKRDYANETTGSVVVPAGTRLSVRTIDAIDSTKNHVGDRFEAGGAPDRRRQGRASKRCECLWPSGRGQNIRDVHGQISASFGVGGNCRKWANRTPGINRI